MKNNNENNDFILKPEEIKKLIDWDEANGEGCFASNRIVKDGYKVGYMVRRVPHEGMPVSGWWFMAGDESPEYSNNPKNFNIFKLNTICNYDPDIIKYLHSKVGTEYIRINENEFELDDGTKEIYITKQERYK